MVSRDAPMTNAEHRALAAARRLYRHRNATDKASLKVDATCVCTWCRAVRAFMDAMSKV
jgi:hypothetical protein